MLTVEAADDGTFTAHGIPEEHIQLVVQVPGYRFSPKNKSFNPVSGRSIEGLVEGDIDDLVVLLEPGKPLFVNSRDAEKWQAAVAKHLRLPTDPLVGVTAQFEAPPAGPVRVRPQTPAAAENSETKTSEKIQVPSPEPALQTDPNKAGPARTLTGTVVDAQGNGVPAARVWWPARWVSPFTTLTSSATCDAQGRFELKVPEAWAVIPTGSYPNPVLWAYAPGHAIGTANASAQIYGDKPNDPCRIELPPATDLSLVVQKPDGAPAVGAKVRPPHFKTIRAYDYVPTELAELVTATTDAGGRALLPALTVDEIFDLEIQCPGYGTQKIRADMRSTAPHEQKTTLRPVGRIEGQFLTDQLELVRGAFVSIETDALPSDIRSPHGHAMVNVDADGRFAIPEIAVGQLNLTARIDERLPVRPRLPRRGQTMLLAGETVALEIPLERTVRVHGVVRAKDTGKPIAGATVSLQHDERALREQSTTDDEGRYEAYVLAGKVYRQLINTPGGYRQLGAAWNQAETVPAGVDSFELPVIEVSPTRSLTGKLVDADGKPLANLRINGTRDNTRYGFGKTDENGQFTLTGVPAEIELETFEIWTRDEHLKGERQSSDPLVVSVKAK